MRGHNAEFFTQFGFYVIRDFLEASVCSALREQARAGGVPATVLKNGASVLDEDVRRTTFSTPDRGTMALVQERLLALAPALTAHFGVDVVELQTPQLLFYREGDYFRAHRDAESLHRRVISVVVLLNSESPHGDDGTYTGGSLTFYRLVNDPDAAGFRARLIGEEGTLIAFRSQVYHEVLPITRGERYSLVSWFMTEPGQV